jgi:hypothetical protein
MRDQSRGPFEFRSAHLGRTSFGSGSVVVDDDALTIVVPSSDERSVRIRLSIIHGLSTTDTNTLDLELRDGTRLVVESDRVDELRSAVLEGCRALPEVTRALRALGSRRGHRHERETGPDEQQRFFAPLLAARRAATSASTPAATIAAFNASALDAEIHAALRLFATERFGAAASARRALEAELVDLVEPLHEVLDALAAAAAYAVGDVDDLRRWRAWSAQLHVTFEVADRVWFALDDALAASRTWRRPDDAGRNPRTPTSPLPRLPFRKRR